MADFGIETSSSATREFLVTLRKEYENCNNFVIFICTTTVLYWLGSGIAQWYSAGYGLDDPWFDSWRGLGIFLFITTSRPSLGPTQPPIQWVPGAVSLGVKRPGHEADLSPPSSAEVKNAWRYSSTPQYALIPWCSVKAQGKLYLYLYLYLYWFNVKSRNVRVD
jgi:hypothetical protein